ncbi:3927_t:CDS:1, partial [Funneliformis caledonium]
DETPNFVESSSISFEIWLYVIFIINPTPATSGISFSATAFRNAIFSVLPARWIIF